MTSTASYRLACAVAALTSLFLLFGIGALGVIGDGGRPDLMYVGALGVLVVGTVLARLRPRGMSWTLLATAGVTASVAVVALAAGLHRDPGASAVDIVALSGMYAALFAVSGWLFGRAARA